jgi:hypothetical protein
MPREHGGWLDHHQDRLPSRPDSRQRHPERPFFARELETLLSTGVGGELLPQGEVLQGNRPAASEGGTQRPDEQDDQEPNHQPILARQKIANDSSLNQFSRSTGVSLTEEANVTLSYGGTSYVSTLTCSTVGASGDSGSYTATAQQLVTMSTSSGGETLVATFTRQ